MTRLISIVVIIGIALVSVLTAEELYSDKYDDVNVSDILANDRLREEYYQCFMGNSPCRTADMKFYKGMHIYRVFYFYHLLLFMTDSVRKFYIIFALMC